jgi:hypothetical protein
MVALYRALLHLYPAAFRSEFGDEMTFVFREAQDEPRPGRRFSRAMFYIREFTGLIQGALQEHSRALTSHLWMPFAPPLPSRRFMPSQFRFPKSTAVLMMIILAGVILAIEKGEAIQASLPHANPPIAPIQPEHLTLLPTLAIMFLIIYAIGATGWIVLFALRRSGVHRLSEMPAAPAPK